MLFFRHSGEGANRSAAWTAEGRCPEMIDYQALLDSAPAFAGVTRIVAGMTAMVYFATVP